ncbi:hypothetical protein VNO77_50939 [Canavalia gladiata]|uniref:Uncharacterized protein n=1 Tax=Canavalia gladiata TaxID=3824 RepID=A0AAN9JC51_CANGL
MSEFCTQGVVHHFYLPLDSLDLIIIPYIFSYKNLNSSTTHHPFSFYFYLSLFHSTTSYELMLKARYRIRWCKGNEGVRCGEEGGKQQCRRLVLSEVIIGKGRAIEGAIKVSGRVAKEGEIIRRARIALLNFQTREKMVDSRVKYFTSYLTRVPPN